MRRGIGALVVLCGVTVALTAVPATALAVSLPNPEAPRVATLQVKVKGGFAVGRGVQFAVVATHPQGWFHLDFITVSMLLNEQPVEDAVFDVQAQTLAVTGQEPVPIGTPVELSGSFFAVDAGNVRLVHQAFGVRLTLMITPIAPIPRNSVFRTSATDTDGNTTSIRSLAPLAPGFLSWSTLALAVAVALFVGTFVGNTFSTRRHRRREPSVWDVLERRLREESGWRPGLAPPVPRAST
jgi:hypothetical protein